MSTHAERADEQGPTYLDERYRRQHRRVSPDWLQCDVGKILDISLGGAMLQCKRRLKGCQAIRIWSAEKGLILQGRVVWSNPVCFRHHEVGVQWQQLGHENFDTLRELIFPNGMPADDQIYATRQPDLRLVEDDGTEVVPTRHPYGEEEEEEAISVDDDRLRAVIDAWAHLPEELQEAILRMIGNDERAADE